MEGLLFSQIYLMTDMKFYREDQNYTFYSRFQEHEVKENLRVMVIG